jgi:hypothetical protein
MATVRLLTQGSEKRQLKGDLMRVGLGMFLRKHFEMAVAIGVALAIAAIFVLYLSFWRSTQHSYTCVLRDGRMECLNDDNQQIVQPEHLFASSSPQLKKLYEGDGITILFTGDFHPELSSPIEVPKAPNFNFKQPAHRKLIDEAAEAFSKRVAILRKPEATVENLIVIADITSGVDRDYRLKLGSHVSEALIQTQDRGNVTQIWLYGAASDPAPRLLYSGRVVSSQEGIADFIVSLSEHLHDRDELYTSPLVETVWQTLTEVKQARSTTVIFFSDLEQNTKIISFLRERNLNIPRDEARLRQILDQIADGLGTQVPQLPDLQRFEIIPMPGYNQSAFHQLKPFWRAALERNKISADRVVFR